MLGQNPPEWEADVSLANTELEADVLRWLHEIFNKRMFGDQIKDVYAADRAVPRSPDEGALRRRGRDPPASSGLVGSIPDAGYFVEHVVLERERRKLAAPRSRSAGSSRVTTSATASSRHSGNPPASVCK